VLSLFYLRLSAVRFGLSETEPPTVSQLNGDKDPEPCSDKLIFSEQDIKNEIFDLKTEKERIENNYESKIKTLEDEVNNLTQELEDAKNDIEMWINRVKSQEKIIQSLTDRSNQKDKIINKFMKQEQNNNKNKKNEILEENIELKNMLEKFISQFQGNDNPLPGKGLFNHKIKEKVAPKLSNTYKENIQTNEVYVPCSSKEEAQKAALNFGGKGHSNTPINNPLQQNAKSNSFPYISLGQNNQKIVVFKDSLFYDYKFYYGKNKDGFIARIKPGCDSPQPYYHNKFVISPSKNDLKDFVTYGSPLSLDQVNPIQSQSKGRNKNNNRSNLSAFSSDSDDSVRGKVNYKTNNSFKTQTSFKDKPKITWNSNTNEFDVFVACKSKKDARKAAIYHGMNAWPNEYVTPIEDPIHNNNNPNEFPHFHLGVNDERMNIFNDEDGQYYNYHYCYGVNGFGKIARQQPGCSINEIII